MTRHLAMALLAIVLAGCAEGYPSDDLTDTSGVPHDGAESIAKLNALGQQAAATAQWRYALKDRCDLSIQSVQADLTVRQWQLHLQGYWVHIRSRAPEGGFRVTLEALNTPQAKDQEIEVFAAEKWFDAASAAHALMLLSGECKQTNAG